MTEENNFIEDADQDASGDAEKNEEHNEKNQTGKLRLQLDEIMKNMFSVSNAVLIRMLNSLFEEDYDPENTEISLTNNEFVLEYRGYDIIKGDVFLRLQKAHKKAYHYHIDFQTLYDRDMVIRMFAYGLSKARELTQDGCQAQERDQAQDETKIYIPRQLVIYMEEHREIKDKLTLTIVFPGGDEKKYEVAVMKYWQYKTADLVEKALYPLLPLQLFTLRHKLKRLKVSKSKDAEVAQVIIDEIKAIIIEVGAESRRLYDNRAITGEDYHKILLAMQNLFTYLNRKYGNIEQLNKEVGEMIKTLYDPEVAERGKEIAREEDRQAMKEGIHDFLSSLSDYDEYRDSVSGKLDKIKDIKKLIALIAAAGRVTSVEEFVDHL